jgi:hypothetical protein
MKAVDGAKKPSHFNQFRRDSGRVTVGIGRGSVTVGTATGRVTVGTGTGRVTVGRDGKGAGSVTVGNRAGGVTVGTGAGRTSVGRARGVADEDGCGGAGLRAGEGPGVAAGYGVGVEALAAGVDVTVCSAGASGVGGGPVWGPPGFTGNGDGMPLLSRRTTSMISGLRGANIFAESVE